jgi:hypothetical protein
VRLPMEGTSTGRWKVLSPSHFSSYDQPEPSGTGAVRESIGSGSRRTRSLAVGFGGWREARPATISAKCWKPRLAFGQVPREPP